MKRISRRLFVGQAATSFAALGGASSLAYGQLVYERSDWNVAGFDQLMKSPARVKQVYDVTAINGGKFLNNIKNSLNGLHFGFGIPNSQIQVLGALHGPANMLNFDDYVWKKYRIGEWAKVEDPATGQPATRNPFNLSKAGRELRYPSQSPNDENSAYQDTSIEGLKARGVKFLCCHTAMEEQARALVKALKLSEPPETLVKDILGHTLPGVLVVASMVAAIALLQSEARYTYITV